LFFTQAGTPSALTNGVIDPTMRIVAIVTIVVFIMINFAVIIFKLVPNNYLVPNNDEQVS
jgi:hypothetical protein